MFDTEADLNVIIQKLAESIDKQTRRPEFRSQTRISRVQRGHRRDF